MLQKLVLTFITLVNASHFTAFNLHIVPHSHLDAGWLRTIDEYYDIGVSKLFPKVIHALLDSDSEGDRTYTVGDIYYFQRWYFESNIQTRQQVKRLVAEGRLEFVHGGYVSNDEACPNYNEIIINMLQGRRFLA